MGVMKRLTAIVQAKANKALDRAEDPRDTLDLSYEKQLEQLQQVRRGVADVATARKRLELQAQQLQSAAAKLQDQARQAISQNREDLAREALTRRAGIATQLDQLKAQHEQLVQQEQRLVATTQQLEARVAAFRTQKETLKASYTAAQAQTKIGEAVSGISESMSDTGLAMQRAQDKIDQMQARAGAVDELLASGALTDLSGSSDPLQAELDRTSRQGQVDLELEQLKGQLAPPQSGAALSAGQKPGTGSESTGVNAEAAPDEMGTEPEPTPMPATANAEEDEDEEQPAGSGDLFSLDDGAQP
ncbi:MAG TPA: PspA/IM30 family protein [Acidimicrobiales bacterium]|nr:PspA/IM30 family protein [Acidimicrobiales bacterium]